MSNLYRDMGQKQEIIPSDLKCFLNQFKKFYIRNQNMKETNKK